MKSYSVSEIANHIAAKVIGDDQLQIARVSPIERAQAGELTFLTGGAYKRFLKNTKASVVILKETDAEDFPETMTALIVSNPELAFSRVVRLLNPIQKPVAGIHSSAIIAPSAKIHPTVSIGACSVIGEHVVIGAGAVIGSGVSIGDGAVIGEESWCYSNVTLYHGVSIGNRVILHSGVVIGADGFGLANDQGRWEKVPQIGSVIIHDDVEIGANTCVDRGALENTIIETGVKIDNLVQIAHNVVVGAHTVMAGCSCVAGSAVIGKHCIIGGAATIGGHVTICDGVVFTGAAMVTNSVKEPGVYSSGTGLFPNLQWRKMVASLRRLKKPSGNKA